MRKSALAGIICVLILMSGLFFASGFLSGVHVSFRERHQSLPLEESSKGIAPSSEQQVQTSSVQAPATQTQEAPRPQGSTSSVFQTIRQLTHMSQSVRMLENQVRYKTTLAQQTVKAPHALVHSLEQIAYKHRQKPLPAHPAEVQAGIYTLKIGIYSTLKEARSMALHVKDVGYEPSIQPVTLAPHQVKAYKVCAGVFNRREAAQKALKKVKARGFTYAILTPLRGVSS